MIVLSVAVKIDFSFERSSTHLFVKKYFGTLTSNTSFFLKIAFTKCSNLCIFLLKTMSNLCNLLRVNERFISLNIYDSIKVSLLFFAMPLNKRSVPLKCSRSHYSFTAKGKNSIINSLIISGNNYLFKLRFLRLFINALHHTFPPKSRKEFSPNRLESYRAGMIPRIFITN